MFFGAAPNFLARRYRVTINFPAAPGVAADTPVRKNGVNIGRVKKVTLLNDDAGVDLELELNDEFQIKSGELCKVGTGSLITGDAIVEFVPPTRESLLTRFDDAMAYRRMVRSAKRKKLWRPLTSKMATSWTVGSLLPIRLPRLWRCKRSLHRHS